MAIMAYIWERGPLLPAMLHPATHLWVIHLHVALMEISFRVMGGQAGCLAALKSGHCFFLRERASHADAFCTWK